MPKKPGKSKAAASKKKAYRHPIPDRNSLLEFFKAAGKPLKIEQIMEGHSLRGQRMRSLLEDRLYKMERAGLIIENRRREYCLVEKLDLVTGNVSAHKDGFGFLVRDDGGDDIFLSAREMRSLIDGDRAAIKIVGYDFRGRPEGKLIEVLERGVDEVAGSFIRERGIGLVIPDNPRISHRILIPPEETASARPGQLVVVRILDYPSEFEQATGRVIRIIGDPGDRGIATDIAIQSHSIPFEWPPAVRSAAQKMGREVPAEAKKGRIDLREVSLVTIDGEDARDFDDAVYCEPRGDGWTLLVAIADVAHYVSSGSEIDAEATRRGTSVYFPDRVVPMLPEVLSNGLCSLKPRVDRLCLVCEMKVAADGRVTGSRFYEAVMRSACRLTYTQVAMFLDKGNADGVPQELHDGLRHLHGLYRALVKTRERRGAIELDIPQVKIRLAEDGSVEDIVATDRNDAHKLIEECMIAANVEAAGFLKKHKIPGLFRVHDKPNEEKFDALRLYLTSLGLKVPHVHHVKPGQINRLVRQVADRPDSHAISMTLLRTLPHAEYSPDNIGHFGLALTAYAHFTSPIRRYPDLLVHRAIKHILAGGKPAKYRYDGTEMERLGNYCSAYERRAEEATRDVEARLKCQFMEDKLGQEFLAVITSVTHFGVFVQLDRFQVDGLIHVSSLHNDYYHHDAGTQRLIGERTGKEFRLGDELQVVLTRVDLEQRRMDFQPADRQTRGPGTKKRGYMRSRGGRKA